jgi:hypothetical protein
MVECLVERTPKLCLRIKKPFVPQDLATKVDGMDIVVGAYQRSQGAPAGFLRNSAAPS